MTQHNEDDRLVTVRELKLELKGLRWEMRALIAASAAASLTLAYKLNAPGVSQAYGVVHGLFT